MKNFFAIILTIILIASSFTLSLAHSGRTDSAGGHKDNKNASGLGSYHYHHGYSAHLHTGGVCPYSSNSNTTSTNTTIQSSSKIILPSGVAKPNFPVMVNGTNLNNLTDYSPVVINNVTYVPLSSTVIKQLALEGGWVNNSEGLILNSK